MQRKHVVTLAVLHGAGGSAVGLWVAERLGVPFLDRAIPSSVAKTEKAFRALVAELARRRAGDAVPEPTVAPV